MEMAANSAGVANLPKMNLQLFAEGDPNPSPDPKPDPEPNPAPAPDPKQDPKADPNPNPAPDPGPKPDVTQTQAFAKRLKEETSRAKDELIAEMYGESHGIRTYAQYQEALAKQRETEQLEQMKKDLPEDVAKEIIENRKFREKAEADNKARETREKQEADFKAFLDTYSDVKPESIPVEVWQEVRAGKSLVDAYAKYENKMLKDKIAQLTKSEKTQETNLKNADSSTGSVTGNGTPDEGFYTKDQVEKMSREEVKANLAKIEASMKRW